LCICRPKGSTEFSVESNFVDFIKVGNSIMSGIGIYQQLEKAIVRTSYFHLPEDRGYAEVG
jgi:hypothetical protein